MTLVDTDDDGLVEVGETVNGGTVTAVWQNDTITVLVGGVSVTITGTTFYISGQDAVFTPTDGTVLQTSTFQSSTFVTTSSNLPVGSLGPPCFTVGTLIATVDGPRLIETLKPGDLILTADHGVQQLRWIGGTTLRKPGEHSPIRFKVGVLGNNRVLTVSPQHRMLVVGWKAQLFYGQDAVLVAAKHLVNGTSITQLDVDSVQYLHLLFDRHELLLAEGVWTESYFPETALADPDPALVDEMRLCIPQLLSLEAEGWRLARPQVRRFEASLLAA
jgi:hypothetical protein